MATPIVVNPNKPSDIIVNSGGSSSQVVVKPSPADKILLNNPKHSGTPIEIDSSIEWGTVVAIATEIARETIYDAVNGDVFGAIDELEDTKQDKVDNSLATEDKSVVGAINEVSESLATHVEEYNKLSEEVDSIKENVGEATKDIAQLGADKQDKSDNGLTTTNKTIVGAINELKSGIDSKEFPIDDTLSETSTNPVQNKVVSNEINNVKKIVGSIMPLLYAAL